MILRLVDVDYSQFKNLVERLEKDIPAEFQAGVVEVTVSPKTVPDPVRSEVYTLGECIPLEWSGSGKDLTSRIVLYHGSFRALARLGDFDWREEAWETLTHELRHHLEWQANLAGLEAYDWAADQNFARQEGEAFDPVFYRNGEVVAPGIYRVDDDVFIEQQERNDRASLTWHGRRYAVQTPRADARTWVFVTLEGLEDPPPGDVLLVHPGKPSAFDLLRSAADPLVTSASVMRSDG